MRSLQSFIIGGALVLHVLAGYPMSWLEAPSSPRLVGSKHPCCSRILNPFVSGKRGKRRPESSGRMWHFSCRIPSFMIRHIGRSGPIKNSATKQCYVEAKETIPLTWRLQNRPRANCRQCLAFGGVASRKSIQKRSSAIASEYGKRQQLRCREPKAAAGFKGD